MKMRNSLVVGVVVFLFASVFISFFASTAFAEATKPIKLQFVSFLPVSNKVEFQYLKREFIDKVNERSKGELVIIVRGGPEAIPPFDMGVSVQKGIVDMANVPASFFESLVPGSAAHGSYSEYTSQEERDGRIFDYVQGMYKKGGLYFLGRGEATSPDYFYMYVRKEVKKPEDFAKLKLGGTPLFQGFYRELGASITFLAIPEYHSALERGVVDGLCTSIYVAQQFGLFEAAKCIVTPGFYVSPVMVILNLNTWNRLPKHLQKMLTETMTEYEIKFRRYENEQRSSVIKAAQDCGCNTITLSPDVAKWYLNAAREGGWKYSHQKWGATIPKLREVVTK